MKKNKLKKYLLTGLFAILPISITVFVIKYIFMKIAEPAEGLVIILLNKIGIIQPSTYVLYILSFLIMLLIIIILGILISNIFGRRLFSYFEELFASIPLVSNVYKTIRQILNTFNKDENISFQKVGRIEYPRKGTWAICFITGETKGKNNEYYNVFIPTTPIPTSGYLLYIKKSDLVEVNISVEEAMKIIVSGGMITTENLGLD